eukprot:1145109-Pelagomonas_calceolata.AAC.5
MEGVRVQGYLELPWLRSGHSARVKQGVKYTKLGARLAVLAQLQVFAKAHTALIALKSVANKKHENHASKKSQGIEASVEDQGFVGATSGTSHKNGLPYTLFMSSPQQASLDVLAGAGIDLQVPNFDCAF